MAEQRKLPIVKLAEATYGYLFTNLRPIAKVIWIPATVMAVIVAVQLLSVHFAIESLVLGADLLSLDWGRLIGETLSLGCSALIFAALSRAIIVGTSDAKLRFGADEVRIFCVLSFFAVAPSLLMDAILSIEATAKVRVLVQAVIALAVLALRVRLWVAFPAAVQTKTFGLRQSWLATESNFFRLIGLGLLVELPWIVLAFAWVGVGLVLGGLKIDGAALITLWLELPLAVAAALFATAISAIARALTYRFLTDAPVAVAS